MLFCADAAVGWSQRVKGGRRWRVHRGQLRPTGDRAEGRGVVLPSSTLLYIGHAAQVKRGA
jgi:hypothetical protein